MKMLTGFLPATERQGKLFGEPMGSNDMEARRNVGYMTQAFSLYGELTVAQNLDAACRISTICRRKDRQPRSRSCLSAIDLSPSPTRGPTACRSASSSACQLAVAVLHEPSILILDEPTSGVDPIARDAFWRTLIDLSRDDGVTIFVSTHFMNEAERCDRISLMHAGKVLAVGAPLDLVKERGSDSLEDASSAISRTPPASTARKRSRRRPAGGAAEVETGDARRSASIWLGSGPMRGARRSSSCAIRSGSPSRSFGPIILMLAFGYGISFDIENLADGGVRSGRNARRAASCSRLRRLALFLGPAADHVGGRGGERLKSGEHADRRRSAARIRPRSSQRSARRKSTRRSTAP